MYLGQKKQSRSPDFWGVYRNEGCWVSVLGQCVVFDIVYNYMLFKRMLWCHSVFVSLTEKTPPFMYILVNVCNTTCTYVLCAVVATSGIDYNIKLWEPVAAEQATLSDLDEVSTLYSTCTCMYMYMYT